MEERPQIKALRQWISEQVKDLEPYREGREFVAAGEAVR
jgi:hypothetical protein